MSRVALITGASRGIGAATARVLAERGFRVVVNYRSSAEEAEEVVADITAAGGEAIAIKADVTVPGDVSAMTDEIRTALGPGRRARAQRIDPLCHHLVRRSHLGTARRKAGPRAARRIPSHQSCCAGHDVAWLWPSALSHRRAVAPSA